MNREGMRAAGLFLWQMGTDPTFRCIPELSQQRGEAKVTMIDDFPRSTHPVKLHAALGAPRCILGATESTQAGGSREKQRV